MPPAGIVFDIKRCVTKDGPGLRTSVFLKGCPLRCVWCHNPESQLPRPETAADGTVCGRAMTVDEVMEEVLPDAPFCAASGGGVTLTGGEPMMQAGFSLALAEAAAANGLHVALDTSGHAPWTEFERLLPVVDLFLYDLKCMDVRRHRELTGADNALILANLRKLDESGARIWIRCPLVPGLNDTGADIAALRDFAGGLRRVEKVEICPYHPIGLEKYVKFGKTPACTLAEPASPEDVARWNGLLFPVPRAPGAH